MDHRTKCEEMRKKTCDSPKHWGPKCNCMKPNEERVRPAPKAAKSSPKSPTASLARAGRGPFLRRNVRSALKRSSKRRKMLVKVEDNENVDWSDSDSEESESDSDESNISNLIDDEQTEDEDESWREELKKYINQAKMGIIKKENLAGGSSVYTSAGNVSGGFVPRRGLARPGRAGPRF